MWLIPVWFLICNFGNSGSSFDNLVFMVNLNADSLAGPWLQGSFGRLANKFLKRGWVKLSIKLSTLDREARVFNPNGAMKLGKSLSREVFAPMS